MPGDMRAAGGQRGGRRDLPDLHGAVRTVIGLAGALAVATLSYVAVERPFLRRRRVVHVGPAVGVPAEPS
ncbi:MAG TPA: hypothetical protein VJM49_15790 [Acidimicrobiales bacterium]|nr:hypothetical protein [Acidimicrobiales bacterium]